MLARALSKHPQIRKIAHIEPPIDLNILKAKLKSNTFDDNLDVNLKRIQKFADGSVLTFTPHIPGGLTYEKDRKIILKQLRELIVSENLENLIIWLYPPHIFSEFILEELGEESEMIVCDCVDDHRKYKNTETERNIVQKRYEKLLKYSDIVFSVSDSFKKQLAGFNSNIHHIPNAANIVNVKSGPISHPKPADIQAIKHPIIGYTGALSFRIDCQLLEKLATHKSFWNIVLIGTSPNPEIQKLSKQYSNIHLLGPKKYAEIDQYLCCFDVGIIPHLVNDITASMDPLKLYEYLKFGLPVVSTAVAGVRAFKDVIEIANDPNQFIDAVDICINNDDVGKINERIDFIENHSWENRVRLMMDLITQTYTQNKNKVSTTSNYFQYSRPELQNLVPVSAVKILDVGCAAGALGKALKARQNCEVTGVEYLPEVAKRAKNFIDKVMVGDIEDKIHDLPENYFDCIIFADVLEHLNNPEEILSEIKKCLAPNGVVIASIPNVRHWSVLRDLLEGRWDYADAGILDRTHLRFFTRSSIIEMFNSAEFCIDKIQGTIIQGCNVPKDVIDALGQTGLNTSSLDEEGKTYQYLLVAQPQKNCFTESANNKFTSIIILTHNQLDYTKKCIESILTHTEEAFELIIIDNGSKDGTVDYLQKELICQGAPLSKQSREDGSFSIHGGTQGSPVRIKIIKNKENHGFAAGNNQGIEAARGDYILLLNNDVVVTAGWLSRLVACAEKNPDIGIVGPLSNYVVGPQLIKDVRYNTSSLAGFHEFAKKHAEKKSGRSKRILRVVGFCMLIKRTVIDKIGGLDSSYGLGNFEDDDFSLRAALAGFESWMAEDCYIHHFGNRTFIGANIDYGESLTQNWEIFKHKWNLPTDLPLGAKYNWDHILKRDFLSEKHFVPLNTGNSLIEAQDYKPSPVPDDTASKTLYQKIQQLANDGRQDESITGLEKLLEMDPNFAPAHNDLGVHYDNQGAPEKARIHYEQAAQLDPHNLSFQKNLADFYFVKSGRIEDALSIYNDILKIDPCDCEALMSVGLICAALKRPEDAKHFYTRVLENEPWNVDARQQLASL